MLDKWGSEEGLLNTWHPKASILIGIYTPSRPRAVSSAGKNLEPRSWRNFFNNQLGRLQRTEYRVEL